MGSWITAGLRRLRPKAFDSDSPLSITWSRPNPRSWLGQNLPEQNLSVPSPLRLPEIERVTQELQALGPQPLWDGYRQVYETRRDVPLAAAPQWRTSDQVRSETKMGRFFTWLVRQREPNVVVEFGTAFGVSAMYWAAGLDEIASGKLLTFEPNPVWNGIASRHLRSFSARVVPVLGTFEDQIDRHLREERIDIGFVDAIHTSEFVDPQVELLIERLAPGGLILLDDIFFSNDMRACWNRWASDLRVTASASIDGRVGVLELKAARLAAQPPNT